MRARGSPPARPCGNPDCFYASAHTQPVHFPCDTRVLRSIAVFLCSGCPEQILPHNDGRLACVDVSSAEHTPFHNQATPKKIQKEKIFFKGIFEEQSEEYPLSNRQI